MQISSSISPRSPDLVRALPRPAPVGREPVRSVEGDGDAHDSSASRLYAASLGALRLIDQLTPLLRPVE
jgi:hypothetical protein